VTLLMELAQPYRKDRKTQEVTQFSFWLVANSGPRWGESLSKARLSLVMTRASDFLNGSVHPALKMACSQRRNVHLLPRRRSSHFPFLRTALRAPGPSKSPTARLPVGLQFLNSGITKIPEKESTPVGVDIEFYFDSRQCCEKKENSHRQVRASKQARPFEGMGPVPLGLTGGGVASCLTPGISRARQMMKTADSR
jgi:hypothetical protein